MADQTNQPPLDEHLIDPRPEDEEGHTWLTDENWVDDLNVRWRKVIDELLEGSKMVDAYAKAYDIDTSLPKDYNVASAAGSRLLRNVKFQKLWDRVNEERGFNDHMADARLVDLIVNPGYEPKDRIRAIVHYNELRGRVVKKVDHTNKGEKFENPYGQLTPDELRKLAEEQPDGDNSTSQA